MTVTGPLHLFGETVPTAIWPRMSAFYDTGDSHSNSGQIFLPLGSLAAGSLVVWVMMGVNPPYGDPEPPSFGLSNDPQAGQQGEYGYPSIAQSTTLTTGENIRASGFMVGYQFVPASAANNPALGLRFQVFVDLSSHYACNLQVQVYDGADPNGTVVYGTVDSADPDASNDAMAAPTITTTGPTALLTVWCSQGYGDLVLETTADGRFNSSLDDTLVSGYIRSALQNKPAGTFSGAASALRGTGTRLAAGAQQGYVPRVRCAVMAFPLLPSEGVGFILSEEG